MIEELASIGARHVFWHFLVEDLVIFAIIALIFAVPIYRRRKRFKKDIGSFKGKAEVSEAFEQI